MTLKNSALCTSDFVATYWSISNTSNTTHITTLPLSQKLNVAENGDKKLAVVQNKVKDHLPEVTFAINCPSMSS